MKRMFAQRLASAIEEVEVAERALAEILRRTRVAPRAEKTTITKPAEDAFSRLKSARIGLLELQKMVVVDED
jgi:hypothetical protein